MTRRGGSADLPLHGGRVPRWLADRMTRLGAVMCEAIVLEYGRDELLRRLAHPFWFQSFGAVMGMDWHSSGITTSVLGALKRGLAPLSGELGVHVCGGRGRHSRATPGELLAVGERTGLDGAALAQASRMVAKVDSAAVQDGFQLYLHGFIVTDDGRWVVVQQGMHGASRQARRYHWLSEGLTGFLDDPHAAVDGPGQGTIVNLADRRAAASRDAQVALLRELGAGGIVREFDRIASSQARTQAEGHGTPPPARGAPGCGHAAGDAADLPARGAPPPTPRHRKGGGPDAAHEGMQLELLPRGPGAEPATTRRHSPPRHAGALLPHLAMPDHHDLRGGDVVLRRLHGALAAAAECGPRDFAALLQVPGVGARTVRALALVAEVLHGTPCRFTDPARFSLAHGGKDRHPFPVPTKVYDHTIGALRQAVGNARLGRDERLAALKRLDAEARRLEHAATGPSLGEFIAAERHQSHDWGGRSVFGWEPPAETNGRAARSRRRA